MYACKQWSSEEARKAYSNSNWLQGHAVTKLTQPKHRTRVPLTTEKMMGGNHQLSDKPWRRDNPPSIPKQRVLNVNPSKPRPR